MDFDSLTVIVFSFSLKKAYPPLDATHGGGFVFDCRLLPNPGREERFHAATGLDPEVREYLEARPEVASFLGHTIALSELAVTAYKERGFSYLSIGYGCTGGQHRSVYCAEACAAQLRRIEAVSLTVAHLCLGSVCGGPA